ncbi:MAG: Holliday junction resolvase [Crenarchaeota archaeon]|nr:Holliday junction resolvase [Thermoproteota archaeon]
MRSRSSYERELAQRLFSMGWVVMRAPASGAAAKRYLYPDLVGLKLGRAVAIEVKTTKVERTIYLSRRQYEILKLWEERGGAEPWLAVKVLDGRGWRLYELARLEEAGESYRLHLEGGLTLDQFDARYSVKATLTAFAEA